MLTCDKYFYKNVQNLDNLEVYVKILSNKTSVYDVCDIYSWLSFSSWDMWRWDGIKYLQHKVHLTLATRPGKQYCLGRWNGQWRFDEQEPVSEWLTRLNEEEGWEGIGGHLWLTDRVARAEASWRRWSPWRWHPHAPWIKSHTNAAPCSQNLAVTCWLMSRHCWLVVPAAFWCNDYTCLSVHQTVPWWGWQGWNSFIKYVCSYTPHVGIL